MSEVVRNLERLNVRVLPAKIKRGLAVAGKQVMTDALTLVPTVPIRRIPYGSWSGTGVWTISSTRKMGELRASGAVFVNGVKTGTSLQFGEMATGRYQPTFYGGPPIQVANYEACIVFNAPYAAIQHEHFVKKTEPTAGKYYLSNKLYGNSMTYMAIIAEAVRL